MKPEALARELAHLGTSDARLIARMEARYERLGEDIAAFKANQAQRCAALTVAARLACDAGHIDEPVTASIIAPKPDPEPEPQP